MKCPICDDYIDAKVKYCVRCGSFLKGRSDTTDPNCVDFNNDSLEMISKVQGISGENAVFIVRERKNRGGFFNLTEVANFLNKSYEEQMELTKVSCVNPIKGITLSPKTNSEKADIPEEWTGYIAKIDTQGVKEEKQKKKKQAAAEKTLPQKPVDVNNADEEEIAPLPGIGSILAKRIISERNHRGGFESLQELGEAAGLKDFVLKRLEPLVEFGETKQKNSDHRGRVIDY